MTTQTATGGQVPGQVVKKRPIFPHLEYKLSTLRQVRKVVKKGQNIDHVVIECPLLPHNIKRKAFVSFYMRHFSFFVLLFCQETRDVQKKKSFYVLHCQTSRRRSRHTQGDLTQMFPTIPNPIVNLDCHGCKFCKQWRILRYFSFYYLTPMTAQYTV